MEGEPNKTYNLRSNIKPTTKAAEQSDFFDFLQRNTNKTSNLIDMHTHTTTDPNTRENIIGKEMHPEQLQSNNIHLIQLEDTNHEDSDNKSQEQSNDIDDLGLNTNTHSEDRISHNSIDDLYSPSTPQKQPPEPSIAELFKMIMDKQDKQTVTFSKALEKQANTFSKHLETLHTNLRSDILCVREEIDSRETKIRRDVGQCFERQEILFDEKIETVTKSCINKVELNNIKDELLKYTDEKVKHAIGLQTQHKNDPYLIQPSPPMLGFNYPTLPLQFVNKLPQFDGRTQNPMAFLSKLKICIVREEKLTGRKLIGEDLQNMIESSMVGTAVPWWDIFKDRVDNFED